MITGLAAEALQIHTFFVPALLLGFDLIARAPPSFRAGSYPAPTSLESCSSVHYICCAVARAHAVLIESNPVSATTAGDMHMLTVLLSRDVQPAHHPPCCSCVRLAPMLLLLFLLLLYPCC